jgi:hypothetical protein
MIDLFLKSLSSELSNLILKNDHFLKLHPDHFKKLGCILYFKGIFIPLFIMIVLVLSDTQPIKGSKIHIL